jgi:hypothetical protein
LKNWKLKIEKLEIVMKSRKLEMRKLEFGEIGNWKLYLVDFALEHKEFNQCWCMVDGFFNGVQCLLVVLQMVMVLGQIIKHPQNSSGRLLFTFSVK